ncbi:Permease of the drug/metabolite transporter (DMT) superfamily [Geosporobacter subterraneus DSM 17957]|uniref:Permease of the drug/metabolite transporter (DMT) superfamily n=1 Tax=Geosporobacter subterraneus DSM 17957 TaxID=1121919 RepID=A0A1M6EV46_9FIRM|nr:DMT family transporter [Geosporobacter subterraneus]SHI89286.1 Permease of the drug/metabolite transporter (DMT) superfamily [Geosporobacter subterraneus DSM 17957]
MKKQHQADLALLLVTLAWGISFILTKNTLDTLSTFNFLSIRFIISALTSALIFYKRMLKLDRQTLKYGLLIGVIMFLGYATQTLGLNYTTASKSGFITGFSVVIVPIFSALVLKKAPKPAAILGVVFAIVGLGLLTLDNNLSLNMGDLYTLIGAFCFAFHIITVSKYAVKVDAINLAILQIGVVGVLSGIISLLFEAPVIPTGAGVWGSILFLSFVCTSGAFIIQNTAQKYTTATHTALIFSGEPVFSAMFAYLLAGEVLTGRGIIGSILILSGMLAAELDINLPFWKPKAQVQDMDA